MDAPIARCDARRIFLAQVEVIQIGIEWRGRRRQRVIGGIESLGAARLIHDPFVIEQADPV